MADNLRLRKRVLQLEKHYRNINMCDIAYRDNFYLHIEFEGF